MLLLREEGSHYFRVLKSKYEEDDYRGLELASDCGF
jgi:hypothetical protein